VTGIGIALGNPASAGRTTGGDGVAYAYRSYVEETALLTSLGVPYQWYRSRTKRIIPFVF
jgi:protein-S-isoprenylcysteine O-methyltransferase Ste14